MDTTSDTPPKPKQRVIKQVVRRKKPPTEGPSAVSSTPSSSLPSTTSTPQPNLQGTNVNKNNNNNQDQIKDEQRKEQKKEEYRKVITDKVNIEKKTFEVQSILIEYSNVDEDQLKYYSKFLQPNHYDDVVEERAIAKICGYPTCKKRVVEKKTFKYFISVKEQKVYDQKELDNFCSTECLTKSKLFRSQLDITPVYLRENITEILKQPEDKLTNVLEQNLKIIENTEASNQPVNMDFGNVNSDSPITQGNKNVNQLIRKVQDQDVEMKMSKSNSDLNLIQQDDQYTDKSSVTDGMLDSQIDDDDEEGGNAQSEGIDEDDDDEDFGSMGDESFEDEEEGSLYTFMSKTKIKPPPISNYHSVYSPLSEWRTIETERFLKNDNVEQQHEPQQLSKIKMALHHYLSIYFPTIVNLLNLQHYISSDQLSDLVDTFSLTRPIPALTPNQWKMIVLVLIKTLSFKSTNISNHLEKYQSQVQKLHNDFGFDQYYLKVFVDLMINGS